ncbi:hypothetical protein, partial [Streptomyces adustus]
MRAVVYEGERRVAVREVEDAVVEEETDALVRITSSAPTAPRDPGPRAHVRLGGVRRWGVRLRSAPRTAPA